jgi:hypothetical protein
MFTFDQTRAWLDTDLENGTDEDEIRKPVNQRSQG